MNTVNSIDSQQLELYASSIRSRRTINFFKRDPVPDSLILDAIEVARWAPNHKKTEPWHFHLLGTATQRQVKALITDIKAEEQGDAARKAISERLDAIPGWMVISCDVSTDPIRQIEDFAACACAAQNMMLYLWQARVGTKWTTGKVIRNQAFFDLLGIDKNNQMVVGLFWYGYPERVSEQTRKPLSEITNLLD